MAMVVRCLVVVVALLQAPGGVTASANGRPDADRRSTARIPSSSIAPRVGNSAVWTGDELIVWGGEEVQWSPRQTRHLPGDGAAYNPKERSWLTLSDTLGLRGRTNHVAVWTGSEMIIWGGLDEQYEHLVDGGLYNPRRAGPKWRPMAEPPFAAPDTAVGAWTGTELIVVMGTRFEVVGDLVTSAAAYDPARDTWRMLSSPPLPTEHGAQAVATGGSIALIRSRGFATRLVTPPEPVVEFYDPVTDRWTVMNDYVVDLVSNFDAVWTGGELLVFVGLTHDANARSVALDITSQRVLRELAPRPRIRGGGGIADAIWTGEEALVLGYEDGVAYRPTNDHWRHVPAPPPIPSGKKTYLSDLPTAAWSTDRALVWGAGCTKPRNLQEGSVCRPIDLGFAYLPGRENVASFGLTP